MEDIDLSGIKHRLPRPPVWLWMGLSFILPFLYCLYYGRIGFNPLDSPIVFDGGYRILQGQDYLIDFFSPAGYIPSLIQSFFFRVFGVNWFAFCLHAALFNGLFALVVFKLMRLLKASSSMAFVYAVLSGLVFYAPFGSPYPEQHAFFFSLLGIYLLVRGGNTAWFFVGPAFLFAFFSKPVPSGYIIILALLLLPFLIPKDRWKQALLWLSLGTLAGFALLALLLRPWEIDLARAWFHFWELPAQTGLDRIAQATATEAPSPPSVFTAPFKVFASYNDLYIIFVYAVPGLFILTGLLNLLRTRWSKSRVGQILDQPILRLFPIPSFPLLMIFVLGAGLTTVSSLFIRLTANQPENGIPFIFLHLGLIHLFLIRYFTERGTSRPDLLHYWRRGTWLLGVILLFFIAKDSFSFHQETIAHRKVHDFPSDQEIPYSGPDGIKDMEWMLWQEPWRYGDRQMDSLIAHLREADTPFFYFGDMTFLYGLMDQTNPLPSLWLHQGLTVPGKESKWLKVFEDQLLQNLEVLAPGVLLTENREMETYTGFRLSSLPKVHAWIKERMGTGYQIELFHLWKLK